MQFSRIIIIYSCFGPKFGKIKIMSVTSSREVSFKIRYILGYSEDLNWVIIVGGCVLFVNVCDVC